MNKSERDRPWKKISSKTVYENKWMSVREDKVIQPDGKEGIYGVVEKDDFILIIPIRNKKIHLVRQYRYPVESDSWEFPEGGIDKREDLETAARRELKEEAGLSADRLQYLGKLWLGCGHHTQSYHIYVADKCEQVKQRLEGSESDMVVEGFTLEEFEEMIRSGEIKDGPTVSAYGLYLLNK